MRYILAFLMLLFCMPTIAQEKITYEGPWYTGITEDGKPTGRRRLQGKMTCDVTPLGKDKWQGKFHGTWHGVKFSYTVKFTGPPDKLVGKERNIDGASYDWKAKMLPMTPGELNGTFTGSRYDGYFKLKEKKSALHRK